MKTPKADPSTIHRFLARASLDVTQKKVIVTASTATPDRAEDIVDQSWDLTHYERNPVLVAFHDYGSFPVGRARAYMEGGALKAELEFDEDEVNPYGRLAAHQFRAGFLSAVSVGFRSKSMVPRAALPEDDPRYGQRGWLLKDNELYEISVCPVPMNPEAVAESRAKAITGDASTMRELARLVAIEILTQSSQSSSIDDIDALFGDGDADDDGFGILFGSGK
jgi:HK97 family phage prohead protease